MVRSIRPGIQTHRPLCWTVCLWILVSVSLLLSVPTPSRSQITWEKRYGGDRNELARGIIRPRGDLAYVVVGNTDSYGPGSPDAPNPFIMKIDYRGQLLWSRTHGTEVWDGVYDVREALTERGFVMCGYRRLTGDHEVMLVIRTDPLGNLIWDRTYGGDFSGFATSVTPTLDGGFLVTGYLGEGYPTYAHGCLLKLDAHGTVLWKRLFDFPFGGMGYRVIELVSGDLVLAGWANLGDPLQEQFFVVWTDPTGLPSRVRYYGGSGHDRLVSIEVTPTGYLLGGQASDEPPVHSWGHLIAISREGDVQWERIYTEACSRNLRAFQVTSDGGAVMTGATDEGGTEHWDLSLMKTDAQGNVQWRRRYGGPAGYTDVGYAVLQSADGGYVVAGETAYGGPGSSTYVIKTAADGTMGSALRIEPPEVGGTPVLVASPNPFRSVTTLPGHEGEPVVLYDIAGRIVGRYDGSRVASDLSPGVYFLRAPQSGGAAVRIVKLP